MKTIKFLATVIGQIFALGLCIAGAWKWYEHLTNTLEGGAV